MDKEQVKKGMQVLLKKRCPHTERNYGTNSEMRSMMGKIHTIKNVNSSASVQINSYTFSIKDLDLIPPKTPFKKDKKFLFNIKELDVGK